MSSPASILLAKIQARGVKTEVQGGKVRLYGNKELITPRLCRLVRKYKAGIIQLLTVDSGLINTKTPKFFGIPSPRGQENGHQADPHDLLRDPSEPLTFPFGSSHLPFGIWDGELLAGKWVGIDTETHLIEDPEVPRLVVASISDGRQHFVIARDRIAEFLQLHHDRSLVCHSVRFDFWVLADWLTEDAGILWDIADAGRLHCTDLLEQLIRLAKFDEFPRKHSLDALSKHYLKIELFGKDDPRRTSFADLDGCPLSEFPLWELQYAVQDAVAAVLIHTKQRKIADQLQPDADGLLPNARSRYGLLTEKLQVKAAIVLDGIWHRGMELDPNKIAPARESLREEVFALAEQLDRFSTKDRPLVQRYKQQRFITEGNRGYKIGNKTATPQKHEDEIRSLFSEIAEAEDFEVPFSRDGKLSLTKGFWQDHRDHEVVGVFLRLQSQAKLLSFFCDLKGSRIHSQYNPIVRSGRVSCRGPNLQQMPRSGSVREMFIASPGHVLFAIDFRALELATLAAVCLHKYGKSRLAEVINEGKDAHAYSYCRIHDISEDEFAAWKKKDPSAAKAARNKIKPLTFGIPGSMRPPGLVIYAKQAYRVELSIEEATAWRELMINDVFPEWGPYLRQTGYKVHTLTGRVRGKIERSGQLLNTQFQGLSGDGAKACLWKLHLAGYRLLAFLHDEFLIELPEADDYSKPAKAINKICCETMGEFTPGVTISCEFAVSRCWSKQAEAVYDDDGRLVPWVSY